MLSIMTATRDSELKSAVLRRICEKSGKNGAKKAFLLVPETLSHEAERELCRVGGNSINLRAEVITFKRLSRRIFGEVGGLSDTVIDDGGRLLMIRRALDGCRSMLKYFSRSAKKTDMLSSMSQLCAEFLENGITPEQLFNAAQDCESALGTKLSDICLIYSAYCAQISSVAFDPANINSLLAARIPQSRIIAERDIYFLGYSGFTPPEYEVICRMLLKTDVCAALVFCQKSQDPMGVFEKERMTINRLRRAAAKASAAVRLEDAEHWVQDTYSEQCFNTDADCTDNSDRQCIAALADSFLCAEPEPFYGQSDAVTLFAADTIRSECEYCAAQIKRLVREKNLRYRDISVTVRATEPYAQTVQAVFEKYDIPIFLSIPSDILSKPFFTFILSALDFFCEPKRGSLLSMLKSGFSDMSAAQISVFEAYLEFWDIDGRALLDGGFAFNPDGYSRQTSEQSKLRLEQINSSYGGICSLLRKFYAKFKNARTVHEFIVCLYEFYVDATLEQKLSSKIEDLYKSGQPELAEQYAQIQDIFIRALTQFNQICGQDAIDSDEFYELMRLLLSSYKIDTIPVLLDSVNFCQMDRMSFINRPYLFVLGAYDGMLPFSCRRSGILSEEERDELIGLNLPFGQSSSELSDCELGIIFKSITAASRGVFISYPRYSQSGAELSPSFLFRRIEKALPNSAVVYENEIGAGYKSEAAKPYFEFACLALSDDPPEESVRAYRILSEIPSFADKFALIGQNKPLAQCRLDDSSSNLLFGDTPSLSPSAIEKYSSCRFSYFMQYGLGIKSPAKKPFDYPDIGVFVHYILENTLNELYTLYGGFEDVRDSDCERIIGRLCSDYIAEVFGGFDGKPARFKFLFDRLCRGVRSITQNSIDELKHSLFRPISFERSTAYYTLCVNGRQVRIGGRPDRIDAYSHDGRLYLRVTDYKTGSKKFNLSDIKFGLNLQMLIYLFASVKGFEASGKGSVCPAGILYVPAKEPFISAEAAPSANNEQERQKQLHKALKRSGLLLNKGQVINAMERDIDGEAQFIPVSFNKNGDLSAKSQVASEQDFKNICAYTDKILCRIISDMDSGKADVNPYFRAPDSCACDFCSYRLACLFDSTSGDAKPRRICGCKTEDFLNELSIHNK